MGENMPPFPYPTQLQDRPTLRKASLSPAPEVPLCCFLWLFLLPGLQVRGLHFPSGAPGPSFSVGSCVSAVSVARDRKAIPTLTPDPRELPRSGIHRGRGLSSPQIPRRQPELLVEPASARLASSWYNCKYQDCSLQMPGTLPQLQSLTLAQQVTLAISTYRPSFCTHVCQMWSLGNPRANLPGDT